MRTSRPLFIWMALWGIAAGPVNGAARIESARLGTYVAGGLGLYAPLEVWRKDIAKAKESHFGIVRFNSDAWDLLEPRPGQFHWQPLDEIVALIEKEQMDILFTIPISSRWNGPGRGARVRGFDVGPTHFPAKDPRDIARLAAAIATRYRGRIQYYEIWNEPDFGLFWKAQLEPSADDYLAVLKPVSEALRKADPSAHLLMGGLAKPKEQRWLEALLAKGGGRYFDFYNLHVYPAYGTFDQALGNVRALAKKYQAIKPLWITETSTTGLFFDSKDRNREEYEKAVYLVKNYARLFSEKDVDRVFWHTLRNPGPDIGLKRDMDFGLLRSDGSPLPAYQAYQTFVRLLLGFEPQGPVTEPSDVEGFQFAKGANRIWVVWAKHGKAHFHVLSDGAQGTVTPLFGPTARAGDAIELTTEPVFVEVAK